MTPRNDAFVSALVGGLAASGVSHVVVCPGSRNTPLSLAVAAHEDISDWSHHDERSAAFFALGLAATIGTPVAVVTTSGTAAVELHPAVVEAAAAGVPLILLTADRPAELHDIGAPQSIDQRSMFGPAVRWYLDLDIPDPADMPAAAVTALAARVVQEAITRPARPVHLNLRFREPLMVNPSFDDLEVPALGSSVRHATPETLGDLAALAEQRTGVIVAGPSRDPALPRAATALAAALRWPILSDPISGLRAGDHPSDHVVGSDLLAASGMLELLEPTAVIRVGAPPTSKALRAWLATGTAPQALVTDGGWPDPGWSTSLVVRSAPAQTLTALADRVQPGPAGWVDRWTAADRAALDAADQVIDAAGGISEPSVARSLAEAVPDSGVVWTGSSMPIRDVDSFFPVTARRMRLYGNRGANGIDGFASTALGSAAAGFPTVAHLGDVSMLHDVGSLATAARLDLPITFLVVNNDGGGIFHFLPQAGHAHFERHFGTPHGLRFQDVAEGFGVDAVVPESIADLETAISGTGDRPRLVEVHTERVGNAELHRKIEGVVRDALSAI